MTDVATSTDTRPAPVGRDAFNYIRENVRKGVPIPTVARGLNWTEEVLRRICWRYMIVDLPSELTMPRAIPKRDRDEQKRKKYISQAGIGRPHRDFPRHADIRAGITRADKNYICELAEARQMAPSGLVGAILEAVIDRNMIDQLLGPPSPSTT